jgi:manganese/zinc/iron transport system permease protein
MVILASAIGIGCGVTGAVASSVVPRLPTGPTIVLMLTVAVTASMSLAPSRGLVWRWLRLSRIRGAPPMDPVLIHLYALSLQHADEPEHGHSIGVLKTMSPRDVDVQRALDGLQVRGLARQTSMGGWAPTEVGRLEAQRALDEGAEDMP